MRIRFKNQETRIKVQKPGSKRQEPRTKIQESGTRLISILIFITFAFFACAKNGDPHIEFGMDECQSCGMVIDRPTEATGLMVNDEFLPFDNPICLMHMINQLKNGGQQPTKIWVSDYTTGEFISLKQSTFFIGEIQTIMNYGILAYKEKNDAIQLTKKFKGEVIDAVGFRTRYENPDKTITVEVSESEMKPNKIVADKGDVLSLIIKHKLPETNYLFIQGYESLHPIELRTDNSKINIKIIVDKPGAGFPVVLKNNNNVIGQLMVRGSHTDEESI